MKKITTLFVGFMLACVSSIAATAYWGHRYDTAQENQNPQILIGQSVTMSVEWNQGDWQSSQLGYGTSMDGSDWTWVDLPWFQNGEDNNKRCQVVVTPDAVGKYYYVYKFTKGDKVSYQYGSADWSENAAWNVSSIVSYIDVLKMDYHGVLVDPTLAKTDIDSIVINAVAGYEYAIVAAGGETSALVFQNDTVFKGLTSNTSYDIYQRAAETDTTHTSDLSAKLTVQTATPTFSVSSKLVESFSIHTLPNQMMIKVNTSLAQAIRISVVNLAGQMQTLYRAQMTSGDNSIALPKVFEPGIYIVNVATDQQQINRKILIP